MAIELTPKKNYCERYDVYFDNTGKLLEKSCKDPSCTYCKDRPNKFTKNICSKCNQELLDESICRGINGLR